MAPRKAPAGTDLERLAKKQNRDRERLDQGSQPHDDDTSALSPASHQSHFTPPGASGAASGAGRPTPSAADSGDTLTFIPLGMNASKTHEKYAWGLVTETNLPDDVFLLGVSTTGGLVILVTHVDNAANLLAADNGHGVWGLEVQVTNTRTIDLPYLAKKVYTLPNPIFRTTTSMSEFLPNLATKANPPQRPAIIPRFAVADRYLRKPVAPMTGSGETSSYFGSLDREKRSIVFKFDGNQRTGGSDENSGFAACFGYVLAQDSLTNRDTTIATRIKYFYKSTPKNLRAVFDACVAKRETIVILNGRLAADTRAGPDEVTIFTNGTVFGLPTRNTTYTKALNDVIELQFNTGVDRPNLWRNRISQPLPHPTDDEPFHCTLKLLPTLDPRVEACVKRNCRDATITWHEDEDVLICSKGHHQPDRDGAMHKMLNALPVLLKTTDDTTFIAAIVDPNVASALNITDHLGDPDYEPADLVAIMNEKPENYTIEATTRHVQGTTYLTNAQLRA